MSGWKSMIPRALALGYNLLVKLSPKLVLVSFTRLCLWSRTIRLSNLFLLSFPNPLTRDQLVAYPLLAHSSALTRVFSFALQPWKVHCFISTREVPTPTLCNSPFTGVHLLPRQTALFSFHFQVLRMNSKTQSFGFYKCPILRHL